MAPSGSRSAAAASSAPRWLRMEACQRAEAEALCFQMSSSRGSAAAGVRFSRASASSVETRAARDSREGAQQMRGGRGWGLRQRGRDSAVPKAS
eukprot:7332636-Alexandrium_andersonii.AAC.1